MKNLMHHEKSKQMCLVYFIRKSHHFVGVGTSFLGEQGFRQVETKEETTRDSSDLYGFTAPYSVYRGWSSAQRANMVSWLPG